MTGPDENGFRWAELDDAASVSPRIALISDIHSNIQALEAVLEAIDSLDPQPDAIVCLGDVVGYNADPQAAVELVRDRVDATVLGNHDWAVTEGNPEGFNPMGVAGVEYTDEVIDDEARGFLDDLPVEAEGTAGGVTLEVVHASPDDPLSRYVFPPEGPVLLQRLAVERRGTAPHVLAIGHTHVPMGFVDPGPDPGGDPHEASPARERIRRARGLETSGGPLQAGPKTGGNPSDEPVGAPEEVATLPLEGEAPVALVNPGSVGQPRDGDPRAAFAVVDTGARTVTWYRVPYDIDAARAAVIDAGLPRRTGERLLAGQ